MKREGHSYACYCTLREKLRNFGDRPCGDEEYNDSLALRQRLSELVERVAYNKVCAKILNNQLYFVYPHQAADLYDMGAPVYFSELRVNEDLHWHFLTDEEGKRILSVLQESSKY